MNKFSLRLSTRGRVLEEDGFTVKQFEMPLALTSIALESFHGLITGEKQLSFLEVNKATKSILLTLGIEGDISTISIRYDDSKYEILCQEIEALRFAVKEWVVNKTFTAQSDISASSIEGRAAIFLQSSLAMSPVIPLIYGDGIQRQHESDSLIDLMWAEVWFEIEKDVRRVKLCPFCSTIYIAPVNNPDKSNCGNTYCKKKHLIESKGGITKYRAWEAARKANRNSNRPVGRPRKEGINNG